jgi:signal transduction histidine kinase
MVVGSAQGRSRAPCRLPSVHLETYAQHHRWADAGHQRRKYIQQVEHPAVGGALTQRLSLRLRAANPWVIDSLLATAFLVIALSTHLGPTDSGVQYHDANLASVLLAIGVAVPYYFRRHAPLAVLLISEACVVALAVAGYRTGATPGVLLVGLYTVAAWCDVRDRAIGAGAIVIGLAVVAVVGTPGVSRVELALNFASFAAAYLFGSTMRNRRLYAEQLEARASALERDRNEETRRALAEERLRIAQELHDVVAHSMGVIAVQAGVGAHVIDSEPGEAKKALEAISQTSRSALVEIRRMLGVLREDQGASYVPAPGLADLHRLVRDVASAGLHAEVRVEGITTKLPLGVDLTAYRIVQEALTNVLKHAGRATATVIVGYEGTALRLEILDDGRGVNGRATPGGHGLVGMRERVGMYGGSFEAGPRTGGGYRVAVRLPYGETA